MKTLFLGWIIAWSYLPAFAQAIPSTVYAYKGAQTASYPGYEVHTLLEGTTRDFSHLVLQTITLQANLPNQHAQQLEEEAVLIVKTGELTLSLGEKRKVLKPGSVAIIMPSDEYRIENKTTQAVAYYMMRYTSNEMPDLDLYRLAGGSFWVDRQEIAGNAERLDKSVTYSTIMSNRVALQKATLVPNSGNHEPIINRAAELIFVLNHSMQVSIGETWKEARAGDVIFVESEVPHKMMTKNGCTYLSLQF